MLPAPSGEPPSADAPRGMAGGPRRMADAPRGMEGEVAPPPKPVGPGQLSWTLPTGWSQTLTSGMRYATLTPAGGTAGVDVSVVVLAGSAGGEPANVNRWRSQIGLPPLSDDALAAVRKTFTTKVGPVSFYDFVSEGTKKSRVVAAIAQSQDNTWFFKMTGSAEAVDPAVGSFTELVKSLRSSAN